MKRSTIAQTFALAAIAGIVLGLAPTAKAADKGCSSDSLKGTFVFRATGVVFEANGSVSTLAVLFTQTFDGNGGLTSTGVQSHNGGILAVTQKGTYTINTDCSGTYTALVSPIGLTVHFYFVMDESGQQLQVLSTDPTTAVSGSARRQFPVGDWRQ
jgi:hypothetical protein